jgi:hypothetical protein
MNRTQIRHALETVTNASVLLVFAGGRALIPKSPLGGPSLRVLQGWGLSLVPFLISIF